MLKEVSKCRKCNLCYNQEPLLDKGFKCDVMWVGLSAKRVENVKKNIPLCNDTNSGMIIELIEKKLPNLDFYKTNLVKCLPLDKDNKLRYPSDDEMNLCISNLLLEIEELDPKIIFVLGRKAYNFINKYFDKNKVDSSKLVYIEHPSYIYVYKRKYIDNYVNKVVNICMKKM